MMRDKLTLSAVVVILTMCMLSPVHSAERGVYAVMGAGARASAFGDAFVAIADDVNAIRWNPATLSHLEQPEITFSHTNLFSPHNNPYSLGDFFYYRTPNTRRGVNQGFFGLAFPNDFLSCGIGFLWLQTHDIIEADRDGIIKNLHRGYAERTATFSLSKKITSSFSTGLNLDYFSLNAFKDGSGFGVDTGFYIQTPSKRWLPNVGLMFHGNFLNTRLSANSEVVIPYQTSIALAYKIKEFTLSAGASGHILPVDRFSLAAEYSPSRALSTLFSYKFPRKHHFDGISGDNNIFTFGLAWRWDRYKFDYSYEYHTGLGTTHRVTASFLRDSPADLHLKRGVKYFEQLQTDEAIEELNVALDLEKNPKTYHYLGLAYERLGELDKALEMLKQIEGTDYYTEQNLEQIKEIIEKVKGIEDAQNQ